jgi:uncharacterized protein YbbC (DUF1343 family)
MRLPSVFLALMLTSSAVLPAQVQTADARMDAYLHLLEGQRIGVVCNHTATIPSGASGFTHLIDTLIASGIDVAAAFGPEHGFRGDFPDGEKAEDGRDPRTGIPVYSLYGTHKKPTAAQLEGLEAMVFDIQDVGVRCYTYLSTLMLVMEACAEQGLPLIVLDRPNPNGHLVDGPVLDPEAVRSFVGFLPIPLAHGMTLGELALMANGEGWLGGGYSENPNPAVQCDLTVIPCEGWARRDRWTCPIAPSPNLPSPAAVQLYPHLVLLEATVASVGRGTAEPFTLVGFPGLPRAVHRFTPEPNAASQYPKHAGQSCTGFQLHRRLGAWQAQGTDNRLHLEVLTELLDGWMNTPAGDQSPFFDRPEFFDKLAGGATLRTALEDPSQSGAIEDLWQEERKAFLERRSRYLRYPAGN